MSDQGKRDKINELLTDCITLSELLWDSDDPNQETLNHAGAMLYKNLKEIEKNISQVT